MVREILLEMNQHEKNGVVQQKYQLKYINEKYNVHLKTTHLHLHGIVKGPELMK